MSVSSTGMQGKKKTHTNNAINGGFEMSTIEKINCLEMLTALQVKTSPIELSIGFTNENGIVNHDFIVIKECAPLVIEKLVEKGFLLSATKQGLIVDKI